MKLQDLTESPYLHYGELPLTSAPSGSSASAIARTSSKLFTTTVLGTDVMVVHDNGGNYVRGYDAMSVDGRHECVFTLKLKPQIDLELMPPEIAGHRHIQVDVVRTAEWLQIGALASTVYVNLAKLGFAVISDNSQFIPGKSLWKKLAAIANKNGLKILVTDIAYGPFKDHDGNIIDYDCTNIPDQDIWTSGGDFNGQYRLLILYKP